MGDSLSHGWQDGHFAHLVTLAGESQPVRQRQLLCGQPQHLGQAQPGPIHQQHQRLIAGYLPVWQRPVPHRPQQGCRLIMADRPRQGLAAARGFHPAQIRQFCLVMTGDPAVKTAHRGNPSGGGAFGQPGRLHPGQPAAKPIAGRGQERLSLFCLRGKKMLQIALIGIQRMIRIMALTRQPVQPALIGGGQFCGRSGHLLSSQCGPAGRPRQFRPDRSKASGPDPGQSSAGCARPAPGRIRPPVPAADPAAAPPP